MHRNLGDYRQVLGTGEGWVKQIAMEQLFSAQCIQGTQLQKAFGGGCRVLNVLVNFGSRMLNGLVNFIKHINMLSAVQSGSLQA